MLKWVDRTKLLPPILRQYQVPIGRQHLQHLCHRIPDTDRTHIPQRPLITVTIALVHPQPLLLLLALLLMITPAAQRQLDQL
jgi:hypothetical protein